MDQSAGTGQHAVKSVQRAKRSEIPTCSIGRLAPDPRGVLIIDSGRIIGTCAFALRDRLAPYSEIPLVSPSGALT